mmetsp:Transcript_56304/g.174693  ORF Transcript_56304/g.174693 Transcript_56304/m.174693 type:complete len:260 (-) Transcript_56304:725-1504(-)
MGQLSGQFLDLLGHRRRGWQLLKSRRAEVVLCGVKALLLNERVGAEAYNAVKHPEDEVGGHERPTDDGGDARCLQPQQLEAPTVEEPVPLRARNERGLREEANGQQPPDRGGPVHAHRAHRVVKDLPAREGHVRRLSRGRAQRPHKQRLQRRHGGATRGDGHEAREDAVDHGIDLHGALGPPAGDGDADEGPADACIDGGHGDAGGREPLQAGDAEGGAAIEAEPAPPEHEGTQDAIHRVLHPELALPLRIPTPNPRAY